MRGPFPGAILSGRRIICRHQPSSEGDSGKSPRALEDQVVKELDRIADRKTMHNYQLQLFKARKRGDQASWKKYLGLSSVFQGAVRGTVLMLYSCFVLPILTLRNLSCLTRLHDSALVVARSSWSRIPERFAGNTSLVARSA